MKKLVGGIGHRIIMLKKSKALTYIKKEKNDLPKYDY